MSARCAHFSRGVRMRVSRLSGGFEKVYRSPGNRLDFVDESARYRVSGSVRVSCRPEKIRKKQDDHESASRFKLLEEPRQKISEDETFEAVYQGRHYESKRSKAGIRFRGWGSEEKNGNSREPGKDEKDQRFADHSPTRRSFWGFISTLFAHKPKITVPILTVERKRQRSTSRLIRRAIHGRNSDYHGAISLPRARYLL